jgi:hypothetical protein
MTAMAVLEPALRLPGGHRGLALLVALAAWTINGRNSVRAANTSSDATE